MNSINKLIKIIESINLTITDENITDFYDELSTLELQYKTNQIETYFLKILRALAKYIDTKRKNIQPDTIPVLNSIISGFAKILDNPELTKNMCKEILSENILKFKTLKNKIASNPEIADSEINELKEVILAIDWEISDITLKNFEKVITALLAKLKYYKIHYAFLKIIHSVVRYIGKEKANAHTDSLSFLRAVFTNFDQLIQTPGIAYKEKRVILETNIKQFQSFKNKIFSASKKTQTIDDKPEDQSFAPALSQFKHATKNEEDTSFTPLSDVDASQPVALVAPVAIQSSPENSENIMDDLFNAKESPADELLDAIHLFNVHGENPDQAMDMLEKSEEQQTDGVKKFTPNDKTNAPIQEINDRLDAFFNLEPPTEDNNNDVQKTNNAQPEIIDNIVQESVQAVEIETAEADFSSEYIAPFQDNDNDESLAQVAKKSDDNLKKIMELSKSFSDSDWYNDESSITSINQNISDFKELWQNDPEKTALLQIITMNIKLLQNFYVPIEQLEKNDSTDQNLEEESMQPTLGETSGIWNKMKNKFKS